jgi:membrane protein
LESAAAGGGLRPTSSRIESAAHFHAGTASSPGVVPRNGIVPGAGPGGELPPEVDPATIVARPPRPQGLRAVADLFGAAFRCWFESGVGDLASAIAFQTQLSLAPFLILVMTGTSLVLGSSRAQDALFDVTRAFVGESVIPSLSTVIDSAVAARGGALVTVISLLVMAYFSSGAMLQVRSAFNRLWGSRSTLKGALYERLVSLILVPAAVLAIMVTMFLGFAGATAAPLVARWFPRAQDLWTAITALVGLGLLTLLLAFVFRYGANARLRWSDVAPGAAITAVLFTIGNALIGRLVGRSLVVPLYGPAGALLVVLLWVYYGTHIVLFGVCFTRAWAERYGSRAGTLVVH